MRPGSSEKRRQTAYDAVSPDHGDECLRAVIARDQESPIPELAWRNSPTAMKLHIRFLNRRAIYVEGSFVRVNLLPRQSYNAFDQQLAACPDENHVPTLRRMEKISQFVYACELAIAPGWQHGTSSDYHRTPDPLSDGQCRQKGPGEKTQGGFS